MLEAKGGPYHMASIWTRVVGPLSCLVASPIDFFFSRQIFWIRLMSERSLKVNNMQKQRMCFEVLKPNERGLFKKP
jgi:hypothetical protein